MANNLGYIVNELSNVYYITDSIKVDKLKSGCYVIDVDQNNSVHLRKIEVDSNHVISLPNLQLQSLLDESTKFWKEAENMKNINYLISEDFYCTAHPEPVKLL